MSLYGKIADLPLEIDGYELEQLSQVVPSGWTRQTTLIRLRGGGHEGVGEDVTWNDDDQRVFRDEGTGFPLAGSHTFDGFSRRLDEIELFPRGTGRPEVKLYRRWGFESAALDLALRQAGVSLAETLGIELSTLRFVVSTGLGDPSSTEPLRSRLELYPGLRFKVDFASDWTPELIEELAAMEVVDAVDLKGLYHGEFSGPPPDAELYRLVAEAFPEAWIEDPAMEEVTGSTFAGHRDRITWDANIHSVADIETLPFEPTCVNIKPSRFGFVSELFRAYEFCAGRGIANYAGGQFELGPGRGQVEYLAALFHPDAPNDVAPLGYNQAELAPGLPTSPMEPAVAEIGFRCGG